MHETSTVRPRKCEDPIGTLVRQLKQYSFRLKGFPLVKPKLLTKIPAPFMDLDDPYLPNHPSTNLIDTLLVEDEPNVRSFYALYSSHLLLLILHLNSYTFAFFNYWLHLLYPSKANHSLVGGCGQMLLQMTVLDIWNNLSPINTNSRRTNGQVKILPSHSLFSHL